MGGIDEAGCFHAVRRIAQEQVAGIYADAGQGTVRGIDRPDCGLEMVEK
jgi:hypothetical protein